MTAATAFATSILGIEPDCPGDDTLAPPFADGQRSDPGEQAALASWFLETIQLHSDGVPVRLHVGVRTL